MEEEAAAAAEDDRCGEEVAREGGGGDHEGSKELHDTYSIFSTNPKPPLAGSLTGVARGQRNQPASLNMSPTRHPDS